jgi:hypothetical protein
MRCAGNWLIASESHSTPGLVQPTKCASSNSSSDLRQVRIWAIASAPVMK